MGLDLLTLTYFDDLRVPGLGGRGLAFLGVG